MLGIAISTLTPFPAKILDKWLIFLILGTNFYLFSPPTNNANLNVFTVVAGLNLGHFMHGLMQVMYVHAIVRVTGSNLVHILKD